MGTQKKRKAPVRPQRLTLRTQADLVSADETLREAILSSGDGATIPAHTWRLVQEGLLAWGLCAGAAREPPGLALVPGTSRLTVLVCCQVKPPRRW
jgi:hypothetical protein